MGSKVTGGEAIRFQVLGPEDVDVLQHVAEGVFDGPVKPGRAAEFLASPAHFIAVGLFEGTVVGMASAALYLHPDKDPQLWTMEVGTGDDWLRNGVARGCFGALLDLAQTRGWAEPFLLTEEDNMPARALYRVLGAEEEDGKVMYTFTGPA